MYEEFKYYKKIHNNISTIYYMLAFKYSAPTLPSIV